MGAALIGDLPGRQGAAPAGEKKEEKKDKKK